MAGSKHVGVTTPSRLQMDSSTRERRGALKPRKRLNTVVDIKNKLQKIEDHWRQFYYTIADKHMWMGIVGLCAVIYIFVRFTGPLLIEFVAKLQREPRTFPP